ncbi:hypothetical protein IWQ62_001632 [Dispira parvispora]|uniref:Anaphase-promoting complex subunit 10 n=1 Tax=Dispira parvispora TaxID=1520584 RepID=A0A9W8ARY4_9FUNG|nr:hypothetical protein IWQ62_001632 [Dispira parvispora]
MPEPPTLNQCVEVGDNAQWVLSSARMDSGVTQLRDSNFETYWQSDGVQPHTITLYFSTVTELKWLALYLDYEHDESYTPQRVTVHAGTTLASLNLVTRQEFSEPQGWVYLDLADATRHPIRAFILQLTIHSNFHYGKDCHIRQMKVYSPRKVLFLDKMPYTSLQFNMGSHIR